MLCSKCGNHVDLSLKFCGHCGADLTIDPPVKDPIDLDRIEKDVLAKLNIPQEVEQALKLANVEHLVEQEVVKQVGNYDIVDMVRRTVANTDLSSKITREAVLLALGIDDAQWHVLLTHTHPHGHSATDIKLF